MLVKVNLVHLCTDCTKKICQRYLKMSTKIPLTDCDIWGLNALENNKRKVHCFETDTSNDTDKISELAKYALVLTCVHHHILNYSIVQKDHDKLFVLGYPGKEYILLSNDARRQLLRGLKLCGISC